MLTLCVQITPTLKMIEILLQECLLEPTTPLNDGILTNSENLMQIYVTSWWELWGFYAAFTLYKNQILDVFHHFNFNRSLF